ncbi:MAG: response regulator transcription factor [Chloroflexi bacterium]|nr:response regulator transcription factor [Chloroflexota bacterium]
MTKILIVDDDVKVTTLLKRYLSSIGHEVTALNRSSKAINTAFAMHPDLFILDIMMPQPDGFRLCSLLRKIPEFLHTPILIITALDDSNSKATSFGADDYLTKPFDLDGLAPRINALLSKTKKHHYG